MSCRCFPFVSVGASEELYAAISGPIHLYVCSMQRAQVLSPFNLHRPDKKVLQTVYIQMRRSALFIFFLFCHFSVIFSEFCLRDIPYCNTGYIQFHRRNSPLQKLRLFCFHMTQPSSFSNQNKKTKNYLFVC